MNSSPAIDFDGTIYFGSNDGYFYAVTPEGTLKWKFQTGSDWTITPSSPAIGSDGTIYVESQSQVGIFTNYYLCAINPDGTEKWKWKFQTGDRVSSTPAIGSDGTIYFGSDGVLDEGFFYAINPDGTEKWKFRTRGWHSSPAIGSDGTIYASGSEGTISAAIDYYLYALGSDSRGLADSNWPKFRRDNQNTGRVSIPQLDISVTPTSYDYGSVNVGENKDNTFVVKNEGTALLAVNSTTLEGTDKSEFSIQSGGGAFDLNPGSTRNVVVRFSPKSAGTKNATLRIASNDPDENPKDVTLSGNGTSGTGRSFKLNLQAGVNLISVPLKPKEQWQLSDLAAHIGPNLNMVIRYDTALGKFVTYMPTFPMDSPADVVVKGSDGYIVVMKKATSVTFTGTAWDGKISLSAGINTTSVPLKSETEWRLSDLATYIGKNVNMIIWYDTALGKFVTWMPTFPVTSPANKIVNGGEGYIVVMKTAVDVTFKGKAWENVAPAAPPLMLNLADNNFTTTPLLVIEGVVAGENIGSVLNGINVTVNNLSTKANMADVTGVITEDGRFVATFVDLGSNCAARVGDVLEITVFNSTGEFSSEMIEHIVTENDIQNRRIWLGSVLISPIPQKNALLQNYPNPFNPETWIPYQLKESATVVIRIYNVSGQLVRLLDIGHRQAGFYVDKMKAAYWDGRNESGERVASGVYFYQLEAGNFFAVRKLTIIK